MKRIFLYIVSIVSLLLVLAYSAFWYYNANKIETFLTKQIDRINGDLSEKGLNVIYSNASVTGYPFKYEIVIHEPKILDTSKDYTLAISSEGSIKFFSNFSLDNYTLQLPLNYNLSRIQNSESKSFRIKFNELPIITFEINKPNIFTFLFQSERNIAQFIANNFQRISLNNSGFMAFKDSEEEIAIAESKLINFMLELSEENKEFKTSSLAFELVNYSYEKEFFKQFFNSKNTTSEDIGKLSIHSSVTFKTPIKGDLSEDKANSEIMINKFVFTSELFGYALKGKVRTSVDDVFPYGKVVIAAKNYQNLIDYKIDLINFMVKNSSFPFLQIKQNDSVGIVRSFREIASSYDDKKSLLSLNLNRKKGGTLFVGDYPLSGVLEVFRQNLVN